MKKALTLVLAITMILALAVCPVSAAYSTASSLIPQIDPGETRRETKYNYAWLDQLIIRDDASAVVPTTIIPRPDDYPYSHTYEEFIEEVGQYSDLKDLNENTVASTYEEIMTLVYYSVVALGMTDDYEVMEEYLRDYGITIPDVPGGQDKINVAVVYAALKYDAVYTLYGKRVSIPVGVTLDNASVIIFSALTGVMLPSGVDTFPGLAVHTVKNYVSDFDDIPVSKNPSAPEVFYWAKVVVASSADSNEDNMGDYEVSKMAYDMVHPDDKAYVDNAYYATILNTAYDVTLDAEALGVAAESSDKTAVARLILETMLTEKNVRFSSKMNTKELFELACQSGCFNLEEEFYSDVFTYDVTIAQEREKIWFTPFSVADQLDGGNVKATTMTLNGAPAGHNTTTSVALDPNKSNETIVLTIDYNDGMRVQQASYTFNIIKDKALNGATTSGNDKTAALESLVGSVNPSGNDNVNEIIDGVVDYAQNELPEYATTPDGQVLTTFGYGDSTYVPEGDTGYTDGYEFNYLNELLEGQYATDADGNIITTKGASFVGVEDEDEGDNFVQKAATVVKENPEIVAAPTSIIAIGALAGYLMTRKHRDSEMYMHSAEYEEESEDEETEE